jgi:hypothetical protein
MKNYIGISRDHSASMSPIRVPAAQDYNRLIADLKNASQNNNIDTIVNVIKCGVGHRAQNIREVINSSVTAVTPLNEAYGYETNGSATPLFASVLTLIQDLEKAPDADKDDVSFLVMVITDGQDNASDSYTRRAVIERIQKLQATDRWTFVFRVPRGARSELTRFGISPGNILEWDQTERGVQEASAQTTRAVEAYYTARTQGVRSTQTFYSDIDKTKAKAAIKQMKDITKEVTIWNVNGSDAGSEIKPFVEAKGVTYRTGTCFYQLVKPERAVQEYKMIVIKDKKAGKTYAGKQARDLLGLPQYGNVKLTPGDHSGYDVYIQSTSINRKLPAGSRVLYWPTVDATAFA